MALKSANQPIRWKERIGILAIGHGFKQAEEFFFDYLLYPGVIAWPGAILGGLVMTVVAALACYLYIQLYDWAKKDWLGLELLKGMRDGEEKQNRITRFFQRVIRRGDWLAFLVLSCQTDAFMTTVYMRRGANEYNGMSGRDWRIFWGSIVVSNLWWATLMTFVVEGVRHFLNWLA